MRRLIVALAAPALGLVVAPAQATVVTFDTPVVVANTNLNGIYLNLATGDRGLADNNFSNLPTGWDLVLFYINSSIFFGFNDAFGAGSAGDMDFSLTYKDLTPGAVVSLDEFFSVSNTDSARRLFKPAGPHTLGFAFFNEAINDYNLGYLNITTTADPATTPATITSWYYESAPRGAITVAGATGGAVPEPATWALMLAGFGAIGWAMRRQRGQPTVRFAF